MLPLRSQSNYYELIKRCNLVFWGKCPKNAIMGTLEGLNMILRFGCSNFKSISDYQELLMTATNIKEIEQHNVFHPDGIREGVLPITAIYGANGAGKTNILSALAFFVNSIRLNTKRDFSDVSIPKFKLDTEFENIDTGFDIDFYLNGKHYHYGYLVKEGIVQSEWLYLFSYKKRMSRTVLFHRDAEADEEYYFSKEFKGKNVAISEITSSSTLFLSTAAKSNHDTAREVFEYFDDCYNFRFRNGNNENSIAKKILENDLKKDIGNFLSLIDIGAVSLDVKKHKLEDEQKELKEGLRQAFISLLNTNESIEFKLGDNDESVEYNLSISRKNSEGAIVNFKYGDESLGTRSLISLLASVFLILRNGGVFIVDELESSLHTLLSLKVVELFNCSKINSKGAQLIFTTHETQLLSYSGFRKDEIWLTEKCGNGSTKLAPLSDYAIPNKSNVRNGYLDGRFGAIPFLGLIDSFENLWGSNG